MPKPAPRIRIRLAACSLAAALLVAFASTALAEAPTPSPDALAGIDASAAIELANAWKGSDVTSYATGQAVHFAFPNGDEVRVPMPVDRMFVSVAPYVNQTHPCTTHYMSGCQGELVDAPIQVRATLPDGTVVLDEQVRTGANGFLDLWLPRDQALVLSVSIDGYGAEGFLTTFPDSATCITTMQLATTAQ